jgi:hypothetical protein
VTFPALTGYGWNGSRYIDLDTGRFVSFEKVRNALDEVSDAAAVRMNLLSQQLINQTISLSDWQIGMTEEIKLMHVTATASANGGWAQVSQSDWGKAGANIKEQYQYLNNFADQIASGQQALDGRFMVRSDMYGDAARGTFEDIRFKSMEEDGFEEEIRVLEPGADHCDGCVEQANLGWQPMGTLDDIGDEECGVRCKCNKRYRKFVDGEYIESD